MLIGELVEQDLARLSNAPRISDLEEEKTAAIQKRSEGMPFETTV